MPICWTRDRHRMCSPFTTVPEASLRNICVPTKPVEIPALRRDFGMSNPCGRVAFHVHINSSQSCDLEDALEGRPKDSVIWRDDGSRVRERLGLSVSQGCRMASCALIQDSKREYVKVTPLIPLHKGQYPLQLGK